MIENENKPKKPRRHNNIGNWNKTKTPEELREIRIKGSKASAIKRTRDANVRKAIETVLKSDLIAEDEIRELLIKKGFPESELYGMVLGQVQQARKNPKSFETIVTMAGQRPAERMSVAIAETQLSREELMKSFGVGIGESEEDE